METASAVALNIPVATYRVQFNRSFGFAAARGLLPYLQELGISHIYSSPYFKAREGSVHGYDIVDHNSLNPELGSTKEYEAFVGELTERGMGQILDIVPNHMCVESSENAWWMDLLENGPSSPYASFFDIDWDPVKQELKNKVLIPVLGDQYGTVLENGELQLVFDEGAFFLFYYDHRFPIIPRTYHGILSCRLEELAVRIGAENQHYLELLSIMTSLDHLPLYTETDPDLIVVRYREKEIVKRRLSALYHDSSDLREFIDRNVQIYNGVKGEPRSFDSLDELLGKQVYRLSHWRVATEEINYRRFFDINTLGAIRMEDPRVFAETHRMLFDLVRGGKVTGFRMDHIDGLYNPSEYMARLQYGCFFHRSLAILERPLAEGSDMDAVSEEVKEYIRRKYSDKCDADPQYRPFYIIGEKILMKGESLPEEWPISGETGYGFLNTLNGIFVETGNGKAFDAVYHSFTKSREKFHEIAYRMKKLVMQVSMSSEVNTLGHYLNTISEMDRHTRDFTLNSLIKALVEVIAFFPVYRTYINSHEVSDRDSQYIDYAIAKARRNNPATNASIFEFIRDVLKLRFYERMDYKDKGVWLDFVMRFQQITGPVMAKGVEDTAYYVYNRLISLNDVGGHPDRFGVALEAFHGQNIERWKRYPHAMLATSTHDTKRSEDVRARINVLSEVPRLWREHLLRWSRMNRKKKMTVDGRLVPDRNEEYLLYQTLIGAWPMASGGVEDASRFRERINDYMLKALREAKVNTSWVNPDIMYEDAHRFFVDKILDESSANQFPRDFKQLQRLICQCGIYNSLSQTLLKIASPGIPDFYQGSELWDLSLVDPDNRRPVDYSLRAKMLLSLRERAESVGALQLARELVEERDGGGIKLYTIQKSLQFRRENRELFESGRYLPLETTGEKGENICVFERSIDMDSVIVVTPRFFTRLIPSPDSPPLGREVWGDTRIVIYFDSIGSSYRNVFTGETLTSTTDGENSFLHAADILNSFPVALLANS
jgi:(1->4)-alpha-D-glucan 1-alpha-D-glucosylmutase